MRIISKFHDYYDSVQKYGQDKNVIYLRNHQEMSVQDIKRMFPGKYDNLFDIKTYEYYNRDVKIRFQLLFFCGVIYPVLTLERYRFNINGSDYTNFHIFKLEEVIPILENEFDEKILTNFKKNYFFDSFSEEKVKEIFSLKLKESDLNVDLKCPIILTDAHGIMCKNLILNPTLKPIAFYKEMETGLTFQKIESFMSGVLTSNQIPHVKVNEKVRLEKRGFDSKLSFRKAKEQ